MHAPSTPKRGTQKAKEVGSSLGADPIVTPEMSLQAKQIPLEQLLEASWNANRVSPSLLEKVRRSILEFGVVENSYPRRVVCLQNR